jgi:hypothetical protein
LTILAIITHASVNRKKGSKKDATWTFDWSTEVCGGKCRTRNSFNCLQNFYVGYRTLLAFPNPIEHESGEQSLREWPVINDFAELYQKAGQKLLTTIDMTEKLLSDDRQGPVTVEKDCTLTWPALPPVEKPPQTRKILIYHEFPMMAETIRLVGVFVCIFP